MSSLPNVIHFNCQSCGMLLTVPREMAGVTGPCPHCRATITSPAAPAPTAAVPGPSWPMAQNAAGAPPVPAPVMTTQVPIPVPAPAPAPVQSLPPPQHLPPPQPSARAPLPAPAPAPAPVEVPEPVHTPSSAWEASNPPQASPLPPVVGGGVMHPAWPPTGGELPVPNPGAPGSAHPIMDSVLQMPGVHPGQSPAPAPVQHSLPPQGAAHASAPFPPSPPPRTSPLASPGNAASQRFKSSRGYSTTRKGPAVLAILMALMAIAGTAWFFRDQIRVAWTTHLAAREAEADALEFHPTPPEPDEPATPPTAFNPATPPRTANPDAPTSSGPKASTPAPVASVGGDGAPSQSPPAASGTSPANPGSTPPEQVQRPSMASAPSDAAPASEAPPQPVAPNLVEVPSASPAPAPGDAPAGVNTPPKRPAPTVPATPTVVDVPAEARPALEALQQFLVATTWEERLKVVQGADLMRPLMESYYASMPDGPLHVAKIGLIRHDKAPQTGPPHCVFQVGGGDVKRPLPIMVEQSPEGWKVDWLTFTEFKDNLLARFMESPQEGPKRFHVLVRRTHYFDDNVPEVDKKICVEVQAPTPPFVGSVFAKKGTPISNILDRYLGWEVDQAAAVVELEWRREGDQQWVELTNLPQFNWRNAIAGEVVPPPHAAPTTPVAVPAKP